MKTSRQSLAVLFGIALVTRSADAATELRITLRFTPKENVTANLPNMDGASTTRPIDVQPLADMRALADRSIVGENRERKTPRPVRATSSVADFSTAVLKKCFADWGVRPGSGGLVLKGEITNLLVTEENTYSTAVAMRFRLEDPSGAALWEGIATGDAHQWGRSFEEENYNEEISDALKRTYANLLSNQSFQAAWAGRRPEAGAAKLTPADAKTKVLEMMKAGLATETIASYLRRARLDPQLSSDDVLDWKKAGIAEEVIRAAFEERR